MNIAQWEQQVLQATQGQDPFSILSALASFPHAQNATPFSMEWLDRLRPVALTVPSMLLQTAFNHLENMEEDIVYAKEANKDTIPLLCTHATIGLALLRVAMLVDPKEPYVMHPQSTPTGLVHGITSNMLGLVIYWTKHPRFEPVLKRFGEHLEHQGWIAQALAPPVVLPDQYILHTSHPPATVIGAYLVGETLHGTYWDLVGETLHGTYWGEDKMGMLDHCAQQHAWLRDALIGVLDDKALMKDLCQHSKLPAHPDYFDKEFFTGASTSSCEPSPSLWCIVEQVLDGNMLGKHFNAPYLQACREQHILRACLEEKVTKKPTGKAKMM